MVRKGALDHKSLGTSLYNYIYNLDSASYILFVLPVLSCMFIMIRELVE